MTLSFSQYLLQMSTDLYDSWCATLQVNTNHTLVNYLLHHVSRNALPGNVMLTAAKSHHARECDVMLSHCLQREMPEFILQRCGHPICRIWIWWTTASGVFFERGSTICRSMIWRSWKTSIEGVEVAGPFHCRSSNRAVRSRLSACVRVNIIITLFCQKMRI